LEDNTFGFQVSRITDDVIKLLVAPVIIILFINFGII